MKKLFAITIMMALAMSAFAYDFSAVCESGQTLYYDILSIENHEVAVTHPNTNSGWVSYAMPEGNLIIPEFVEYQGVTYTVVSIGEFAFIQCSDLTSVEIPNTVVSIRKHAFRLTGLTSVEIPNSVTWIDGWAFNCCRDLLSITIGSSVSSIGSGAFCGCSHVESIHCNTPAPPSYTFVFSSGFLFNSKIFYGIHDDIPVYVNCLSLNQFHSDPQWDQFTNLIGVFVGVPELTVSCNVPGLGTAEIVSLPDNCDDSATVLATPNPGHEFRYWKKGMEAVSFSPEYTFALDNNISLIACFDCPPIAYDSIGFPGHVIGRIFDDNGQTTSELPSDYIYDSYGRLIKFELPEVCDYDYAFVDHPTMPNGIESIYHTDPEIEEYWSFIYAYDNNRIIHYEEYDDVALSSVYDYYYDENWRLIQIEKTNNQGTSWGRNLFEYADNYRTKFDSYYSVYPTLELRTKTTSRYNEQQQILSSQVDTYDNAGDITSKVLETYSYNSNNKTDTIIKQTYTEEEWVNTNITCFVYDDKNRVVECATGLWSAENQNWNINKKTTYDFNDEEQKLIVSLFQKSGNDWVWSQFYHSSMPIFYESELDSWERAIKSYAGLGINQFEIDLHYVTKEKEEFFPSQSEWYYEILWDDGSTTYQHLEYTSDTTVGSSRPKVIVRSNTHYDRDTITETTHEYILEEGNKVYWWNRDLEEYTILYDYNAEPGDEWEIKVGLESITVRVDDVDAFEYDGETHKRLYISDAGNIFNGEIVVGFGHMTSFFPEKLMNQGKGFRVEGLRCYWVEDALLYHNGDEDCDAIHSELQNLDEPKDDAAFAVYPNPTNDILFVETRLIASLPDPTYRITNLTGQTLLQGTINGETQQINIEKLPAGMYFISMDGQTTKFVKQ